MEKRDLDKYENDYESLPFEPFLIKYRRKIVIENILRFEHKNILEIGCGLDPLFQFFTDYSSMTVVEPSKVFYKNACRIKTVNNYKNIKIYNNFFENISDLLESTTYDFIIVSCLLHELPFPDLFLYKISKLCTLNTIIHINVPNAKSFHRILAVSSGLIKNEFSLSETQIKMQQSSTFNQHSLNAKLVENNFQVINEGSYFIKPFTHSQMQALLDNKIIDEQILDGLFMMSKLLPDWCAEIYVNAKIKYLKPTK